MRAWLVLLCISSSVAFAKVAPSFSAETLDGKKVTLQESLKKDRVLLLCFWATWCTPCIEELKQVSQKLKADPGLALDLLAVNVDTSETSSDVRSTLKLLGFSFPVIGDPQHLIFGKYQAEKTLPYSVLITPNGEVEKVFSGYHEDMMQQVKEAIAKVRAHAG